MPKADKYEHHPRIWIELDAPTNKAHAEEQCSLANVMLQRLGVTAGRFSWNDTRKHYCFGTAMGRAALTDRGEWFDLEYLGRPLPGPDRSMELLYGSNTYEVRRQRADDAWKPAQPERIEIHHKSCGRAVLTGQDAEDFVDQLTHCADGAEDHLCAEAVADSRWMQVAA